MDISVFANKNELLAKQYKEFPWQTKELYANYLVQTYHFVKHSTRLLATAAGRMDKDHENIFRRFTRHITEEQSHEVLAERDLKVLGFDLADFAELGITRAFYQSQYYLIEHVTPFALLGYIFSLETLGVKGCGYAHHLATEAFGDKAATFLKVHSDEDPDHVEKALNAIQSLNEDTQKIVWDNFEQTYQNYSMLLTTVATRGFN